MIIKTAPLTKNIFFNEYLGLPAVNNRPPVGVADNFDVEYNTPTSLNVLLNDTDPDNDDLTVTDFRNEVNGTVNIVNGLPVFTPTEGYQGDASFEYKPFDGELLDENWVLVSITVLPPPNDPPIAPSQNYEVALGNNIIIDLLENVSDPEGDDLSVLSYTQPVAGVLTDLGNNNLRYTAPQVAANDSIQCVITDGTNEVTKTIIFDLVDPTYEAESIAAFDRFSAAGSPADFAYKQILDNLIKNLKGVRFYGTTNILATYDLFNLFATVDTVKAHISIIDRSSNFNILDVNSVTFVANKGLKGNGTSARWESSFKLSAHAVNFLQDSNSISAYITEEGSSAGAITGEVISFNSKGNYIQMAIVGGGLYYIANGEYDNVLTNNTPSRLGYYSYVRSGGSVKGYRDDILIENKNYPSISIDEFQNKVIFGARKLIDPNTYSLNSNDTIAFVKHAGALSSAGVEQERLSIEEYLSDLAEL